MKLRHLLPVLLLCLPVLVSAETVDSSNLVKRGGLYYKKFTDVPFTGKLSGRRQTTYKDGKKHGPFVQYRWNGQLSEKGTYKDGKLDGPWFMYFENGRVSMKRTYKDGKQHGPVVWYHGNGQLQRKGTYKDGKRDGPWVMYHRNGQLRRKGTYKDGKRDGPWVFYESDGTKRMTRRISSSTERVYDEGSGIYKDGKKVSSQ